MPVRKSVDLQMDPADWKSAETRNLADRQHSLKASPAFSNPPSQTKAAAFTFHQLCPDLLGMHVLGTCHFHISLALFPINDQGIS